MIYNLAKYLEDNLGEDVIVNGLDPDVKQVGYYLTESGGTPAIRIGTQEKRVQLQYKDTSRYTAGKKLTAAFNLLVGSNGSGRWGIDLPATTIDGDVYPLVHTSQMVPLQFPAYIGADVNGLHMQVVNFKITIGG